MMGAAMLKHHRFVQSLWVAKMCTWGNQAQPFLMYSKNTFCQGVCNDGGSHVEMSFVQSLRALYRLVVSSIMWGSQVQPLLMYSKNTFCQGVCNDGGSHVEMSSICAVPLLWALYRLVVSSIMWGSQVQSLLMYSKNTFHQGVCNDGGSHVEMSSICAVPLGIV